MTQSLLLEPMRHDVLGNYSVAGVAGSANLAGYLLGVWIVRTIMERRGSVWAFKVGLQAATASLLGVAVSWDPVSCIVANFAGGISAGVVWIACVPVLAGSTPRHRLGLAYGFMVSGVGVSLVAGSALVRLSQHVAGPQEWRSVWLVEAVAGALMCAAAWRVLGRPLHRPSEQAGSTPAPRVPAGIGWAVALYLAWGVTHGLYTTFFVSAASHGHGVGVQGAAAAFSVLGITNAIGGISLGRLSDRIGRWPILWSSMVCVSISAMLVPFGAGLAIFVSAGLYGLMMSGMPTVLTASLNDRLEDDQLPAGYAAVTMAVGLGQMVGPPVGGLAVDLTGTFTTTFVVAACAGIVAAAAGSRFRDVRTRTGYGAS